MWHTLKRLATAFDYLRIKHSSKRRYDLYLPAILSLISVAAYIYIPIKPPTTGISGITTQISEIIKVLIGFYIASLAAVATFESDILNEVMDGSTPPILIDHKGEKEKLTRRRFLCLLFAYLVTLCFILLFLGIVSEFLPQNIRLMTVDYYYIIKHLSLLAYFFFVFQLVIVTLLGLYYIADKIHPKQTSEKEVIAQVDPKDVDVEDSDGFKMG